VQELNGTITLRSVARMLIYFVKT